MNECLRFLTVLGSALVLIAAPARAGEAEERVLVTEWVELVPVARPDRDISSAAIASFGPFRVMDAGRAALVDVTDGHTPAQFAAMIARFPQLDTLELVEAPGTLDDRANLRLGRMIRAAGLATHVPRYGSVRSGAVELVFAGTRWQIDDGAEFAVHAWMDDLGQTAGSYAADAPEHRKYLSYLGEMGLDTQRANAFYTMTNAAPFDSPRWLDAAEMRGWLGIATGADRVADSDARIDGEAAPQIAYAGL